MILEQNIMLELKKRKIILSKSIFSERSNKWNLKNLPLFDGKDKIVKLKVSVELL